MVNQLCESTLLNSPALSSLPTLPSQLNLKREPCDHTQPHKFLKNNFFYLIPTGKLNTNAMLESLRNTERSQCGRRTQGQAK